MSKKRRKTWKTLSRPAAIEPETASSEAAPPAEPPPPPVNRRIDLAVKILVATAVLLLLWHAYANMAPLIPVPWFSMSDENVVVGEVIRFAGGDYRQHFFDMPGTPLMLLGALEWRLYFRWAADEAQNINAFTFAHLQQLFGLMRANSLAFYLISIVLLFVLASRLTNRFAAVLACTLFVSNEAYAYTVTSLRVEPIATCFALASILVLDRRCPRWPAALVAGILAGIAAGCRLHSVTMTLPLLALVLWRRSGDRPTDYPPRLRRPIAVLAVTLLAVAAVTWYQFRFVPDTYSARFPLAYALFARAALASAIGIALALALYFVKPARAWIVRAAGPEFLTLALSAAAGFSASTFTIYYQWEFFLKSANFYSSFGYQDPLAPKMALAPKLVSLFTFYMDFVAPDRIVAVLLAAGVAVVLFLPRWRRLLPYLLVAFAFFVSRPLDLQRSRHHIALWIPLFSIVCAAGPAALIELAEGKMRERRHFVWAGVLVLLLLFPLALKDGTAAARAVMASNYERLRNIEVSRTWIGANLPKDAEVHIAFHCFGPEIFYGWFRGDEVPVPPEFGYEFKHRLWWGRKSDIQGSAGYACLAPELDTPYMKGAESRKAGEGIDPTSDPHFRRIRAFGAGQNRIEVYQFDLK